MLGERVASQSEVVAAIVSECSPCLCGGGGTSSAVAMISAAFSGVGTPMSPGTQSQGTSPCKTPRLVS